MIIAPPKPRAPMETPDAITRREFIFRMLAAIFCISPLGRWLWKRWEAYRDRRRRASFAFPLIRRVFPQIAASELVSVQPMTAPSALVFYMDFRGAPPSATARATVCKYMQ